METHISIFLSKLTLAFGDFKNGFLEIIINNKKESIPYPQITPVSVTLPPKFSKDKQLITINAKKKIGNKVKNVAHGELVLYKINLIEGKGIIEKNITMVQLDSKSDSIKINKENMGRIFVKVTLEDPFEEWRRKSMSKGCFSTNYNLNKKSNEKKTNKSYKIIHFNDNLSMLTLTKSDKNTNDNLKKISLDKFININEIIKVKNLFENNYQTILPHDFTNLKQLNVNLYNNYIELDKNYKNILENIQKENNDIKYKAKDIWEKYKKNKKNLYKSRIEYKLKQQKLKKELISKKEENDNLFKKINTLNTNCKNVFNQIIGKKDENEYKTIEEKEKENDIKKITSIFNKLFSLGYTIDDEMNGEEKKLLNDILDKNTINIENDMKETKEEKVEKKDINEIKDNSSNKKSEQKNMKTDENYDEEDENLGLQIVNLIERDVNDLYSRKLIEKMKIDQINATTYSFATDIKEKKVTLKIQNNNLICSNGQSFSSWIISNFQG